MLIESQSKGGVSKLFSHAVVPRKRERLQGEASEKQIKAEKI